MNQKWGASRVLACVLVLAQFAIILTACSTGYHTSYNEGDTTVSELNERQISICEDLGLPTSYDKLSERQKRTIIRIEELLSYLDSKYKDTFYYVGYYEGHLEKERLEAYSSSFNQYEYVTLTVQEDGTFEDDYPFQFVKRIVRQDIVTYLSAETGYEYKAYIINGSTSLTDCSDIELPMLSGNTWVSFTIFVSGDKSEQEGQLIGNAISEWYQKTGIYGSTNVIAVGAEAFERINYENYQSVKREQGVSNLVTCDVSATGDVKIN